MSKHLALSALLVALSLAAGAFLYPQMPDSVASHWGAGGAVDGYMPKAWGVFMLPAITAVLLVLFAVIPVIDPLRDNIEAFRGYFDNFILLFASFMTAIYLQTLIWNLGYRINPMIVISAGLFALLYYTGIMLEHAKRNWSIGIRTPWTLSSDAVWVKTHKAGGRLFKVCGILALAGVFAPQFALILILAPVLLTAAYATVYSYIEFGKERKKSGAKPT
ncbi:MAG: DUF1648 domain-containing protein [Candidatus Altiarchaeota archaeon]